MTTLIENDPIENMDCSIIDNFENENMRRFRTTYDIMREIRRVCTVPNFALSKE